MCLLSERKLVLLLMMEDYFNDQSSTREALEIGPNLFITSTSEWCIYLSVCLFVVIIRLTYLEGYEWIFAKLTESDQYQISSSVFNF